MQIAFGRVRRKTSPAIEPAHSPSIAEIASPHAIRVAQSTQRKGSPDSSRQWCIASAIGVGNLKHLVAFVALKPCCHGFTPYVSHASRILSNSSRGILKRMSTSMARLNASMVLPIF